MSTASTGLRPRPATYAGLFTVTLSTLAYEIVLTRIFSVTMWYHFGFVAISVALFGTTAGALLVHLKPGWFTEDKVKRQMWRFSLAYSVWVAFAFAVQLSINFRVEANAGAMASVMMTCLVISVPFVCAGVVVCLALTRFGDRVNRLYAADLIGAGLGCVFLIVAFKFFDGPSLVVLIAAVAAVGAFLFALDAKERKGMALAGLAALVLLAGAFGNDALHSRGRPFLKILYTKEQRDDTKHVEDRWNPFSRVTLDGDPNIFRPPFGNGLSPECPAEDLSVRQLNMVIDSTAGTVMTGYTGDEKETNFLRCDISNLVYHAKEGDNFDRAAVIGVGGGRDVLSALEFNVGKVTGIEINPTFLDLLKHKYADFSGHLYDNPHVGFANDEGRAWITRSGEDFDSIQISLIDTWAATAAGAFALSENSLYTTDAWDAFLDHLQPGGILSVSRWYAAENPQPLEMLRTTAIASQVLTDRGIENPRDHILIYEGPPSNQYGFTVGTILVSEKPFSGEVLDRVESTVDKYRFNRILTPDEAPTEYPFAELTEPGGPAKGVGMIEADISPPTDNQPFFFQMADLGNLIHGTPANTQVFKPVVVLASLAAAVLLLALICIGGPLIQIGRRTTHKGRVPYYLYFCGIGLGFLMVEVSQLMRLSVFLGHPTYSLAVVLFTVLIFSGIGSMLVEKLVNLDNPSSLLRPIYGLLGLAVIFGYVTPRIIDAMSDETTPIRIAVAVGIMAPLGLLMGMPFSIGMRMASTDEGSPTAFLWGINGAMSVVASVFAMAIALFFGIAMTFIAGWFAYLLAAGSMLVLVRRLRSTTVTAVESDAATEDDDTAPDEELVPAAT
jgi:hypothetical protein